MKLYFRIPKNKAVGHASKIIRSAKYNIIATMDVGEEYANPLPKSYHNLLARKTREGIAVIRYGFGSTRICKMVKKNYKEIPFVYAGTLKRYQRMLIIDGKRAMFVLEGIIFYTEFVPLVNSLVKYVEINYNKEVL